MEPCDKKDGAKMYWRVENENVHGAISSTNPRVK